MEINISKCDVMHILNWLNCFKRQCKDPKNGMHYLVADVEATRQRIFDECKLYFPEMKMANDGQISFGTGKDFWWLDPRYLRK